MNQNMMDFEVIVKDVKIIGPNHKMTTLLDY